MSQIIPLICEAIKDQLTAVMQTAIAESDPTYADVVKIGKFQDDPTRSNIYIAISGGNPEDPDYVDGIVTLEQLHDVGFNIDPREVGGGQAWWRRGVIQIGCYFINEAFVESVATGHAYTVFGRLQANVESINVGNLEDDFGEKAVKLFLYGSNFFESGGPPKSYIFRGKVLWACLTERP